MAESTWTYDLDTALGQVRLMVGDTDQAATWSFSDEELQVFLTQEAEDVWMAAASVLDVLAADQARNAQRVTIGDYQEDRAAAVKALRDQAKEFRAKAGSTPQEAIAETAWTGNNRAQMIANERLRST